MVLKKSALTTKRRAQGRSASFAGGRPLTTKVWRAPTASAGRARRGRGLDPRCALESCEQRLLQTRDGVIVAVFPFRCDDLRGQQRVRIEAHVDAVDRDHRSHDQRRDHERHRQCDLRDNERVTAAPRGPRQRCAHPP